MHHQIKVSSNWFSFVLSLCCLCNLITGSLFQKLRDSRLVDSSVWSLLYNSSEVPDEDHAECIFGAMSLVVDAGSTLDVPLDVDYLETFMYDLFRS